MVRCLLLFISSIFIFLPHLIAQGIKKYGTLKYTVNSGLSSNNIRHISQDQFGYLWISTQDGLNRSDGRSFLQYKSIDNGLRKTLSMDVRLSKSDVASGYLWVLNSISGINAINPISGNVVKEIKAQETNPDNWNITMACSKDKLWIGGNNGISIYNISQEKWEQAPQIPFKKNHRGDLFTIRTVFEEKDKIWVFVNNYGILIFDPKSNALLKIIETKHFDSGQQYKGEIYFTSFIEIHKGTYLVGTSAGLKKITFKNQEYALHNDPVSVNCPLNKVKIFSMATKGNLVFIASKSGLFQLEKDLKSYNEVIETEHAGEEWFSTINHVFIDSENNLWAGCSQGLAYVKHTFIQNKICPFTRINNVEFPQAKMNQVYYVKPYGENFLICMEKGLVYFNTKQNSFRFLEEKKLNNYAFDDAQGNMIISAEDGLYMLKDLKLIPITQYYPELKLLNGCYINSAILMGDSMFVIGSDNSRGIFLWNYKSHKVSTINNSSSPVKLRSNIVNTLFKDSRENIWVLSDLGIDILEQKLTKITPFDLKDKKLKEPPKLFFGICENDQGIWLTSYGFGLINLDKKRNFKAIYNTNDGLSSDGVYSVFSIKNEKIIVSTNDGLSVLHLNNFNFTNFNETDGLHSNAFEENCAIEYNGKFYAGGLNGFTIIDPEYLYIKKNLPKVYFSKISLETQTGVRDTANLFLSSLTIPSDVVRATVHFSTLYFTDPKRTKTFYRIEEVNKNWINTEGQDFIHLIGMKPGKYTIQLRAENENKQYNKKTATIKLVFLPKWHQTYWFNMVAACCIVLIFYLLYFARIRQIKQQQEIRKDIAGDLHDDIGSSLNTVKVFTHLARREKDNDRYLEEIEATLLQASSGMRDMIWVLDDQKDSYQDLIERIEKIAHPVLAAQNIQLILKVQTEARKLMLSKKEKKNLLLISKEAITNCLKYAHSTTITLSFQEENNFLLLKIEDDGCGFDTQVNSQGNGLKNIKYRANQIGFELEIFSDTKGTCIVVSKIIKKKFFSF